jgi:predicted nucleotidyltransferase
VLDVLNRLVEHGLVDRQEAGRALLYSLNREHLAAPAVDVLAGMRAELLNRIRQAIQGWKIVPVSVLLFGSTARGDGSTSSDVDLFVVRPNDVAEEDAAWRAQVDDLATQVERWTGNHAGIAESGEAELGRLREEEPPIVAELRSDAIVLAGLDTPALLSAE